MKISNSPISFVTTCSAQKRGLQKLFIAAGTSIPSFTYQRQVNTQKKKDRHAQQIFSCHVYPLLCECVTELLPSNEKSDMLYQTFA
jgi:hypothetical protein